MYLGDSGPIWRVDEDVVNALAVLATSIYDNRHLHKPILRG